MRRVLIIGMLLLGCLAFQAKAQPFTHPSVTAYLHTLIEKPVGAICADVDRLIDSVGRQKPELQSKVAGICFDFFTDSPVMGHDAVAVHIADDWFLNGKLKLENEQLYPILYTYAEFNRSSLVGKSAPALTMDDPQGVPVNIRAVSADHKILFFYDTECATCRKEAPLLADLLRNYEGERLSFFAIYTQSDREGWERYAGEVFAGIDNPNVSVYHLWDPEAATNFHKLYGVLSTPQLFLLDGQNTILGRGLDSEALAFMLGGENARAIQYKNLFDQIFGAFSPLTINDVEGIADAFADRSRHDAGIYVEIFTHLFNYLRTSEESPKQQGALYVAEKYIAAEPAFWSEEFLETTIHALTRARMNPVGAHAKDLTLRNRRGRLEYLLEGRRPYTLVFFHLLDCKQCQEELSALRPLATDLREAGIKVKLVYVGHEQEAWRKFARKVPCGWVCLSDFEGTSDMRTLYDLEYVPHLYLLDNHGTILAKDIQVAELKQMLPLL